MVVGQFLGDLNQLNEERLEHFIRSPESGLTTVVKIAFRPKQSKREKINPSPFLTQSYLIASFLGSGKVSSG